MEEEVAELGGSSPLQPLPAAAPPPIVPHPCAQYLQPAAAAQLPS